MSDHTSMCSCCRPGLRFFDRRFDDRLHFKVRGRRAKIVVMSFCCREQPTVVCQEVAIDVDAASDLKVRARIDLSGIEGRRADFVTATRPEKPILPATGRCSGKARERFRHAGLAYVTEFRWR